jgi:hypothetical protein
MTAFIKVLACTLLLAACAFPSAAAAEGEKAEHVVSLGADNFEDTVKDGNVWFVKVGMPAAVAGACAERWLDPQLLITNHLSVFRFPPCSSSPHGAVSFSHLRQC